MYCTTWILRGDLFFIHLVKSKSGKKKISSKIWIIGWVLL